MATIFGEGKIFFTLPRLQCSDTLLVKNFDEIALSRTVKETEAYFLNTLWVKNFVEIALSRSISEINVFLFFSIKKNRGI